MSKDEGPIVVEGTFERSRAEVWRAIVEIDRMRCWYFDNIPDFRAEVGFGTEFAVESGGREFLHIWEVTEVIPEEKLVYGWKYGGYPGDSAVTFELSGGEGDGPTRLRVTHQVMEDFPDDVPEFQRESCQGGWEYFIGESLAGYFGGSYFGGS